MNGAGGGGRVAGVGIGDEGRREANVGAVRRISGIIGWVGITDVHDGMVQNRMGDGMKKYRGNNGKNTTRRLWFGLNKERKWAYFQA
jgi:hypothetical protein